MSNAQDVIRRAKAPMATAITNGDTKEPRKALIRKATVVETEGYGKRTQYMVDRCPGCGFPVPVVEIKISFTRYLVSVHTLKPPQQGILCGYSGESLELLEKLPL